MATQVTARQGALGSAATVVAEAREDLEMQVGALMADLEALPGQWAGLGAAAFLQVLDQWRTSTDRIVAALTGFEENLRASEAAYTATDQGQQASFARLAGGQG